MKPHHPYAFFAACSALDVSTAIAWEDLEEDLTTLFAANAPYEAFEALLRENY